ncbi:MAG: TIGR04133 family radical SAM/SPASM protein [Muribaculaceae bacterium]|nr:TIGR04133 family radical SAM/SPASM protein [Muribaculaceae bacterium]
MKKLSLRQRIGLELNRKIKKELRRDHPLRQLFWECTWRCNLSCLHCGSDCKRESEQKDMPAADFLKVIDTITPHVDPHSLNIIITGGEPLVRDDLEYVGRSLYNRGYPWGIVTNGLLLTAQRLESLRRAGIHNITISLDGLEDTHNWMRNNPASFSRAKEAIRMVAEIPDLNFDVVTCVNRHSLSELYEIKELLIQLGVRNWRLFTIFPSGRAKQHAEFELSRSEIIRLMNFIVATRVEGRIKASFCCEGFMGEYEGKIRDGFFDCQAGVTVASILIDGGIGACPSIRADYTQGNIYEDDFWNVWSERYEKYRDREWMKKDECKECKFWRFCEGNGMHLRTEKGELLHCHHLLNEI